MTWANLSVGLQGPDDGWANLLVAAGPPGRPGRNGVDAAAGPASGRRRGRVVLRGLTWTMLAAQLAAAAMALSEAPTDKKLGWPWHIVAVTGVLGAK